ncbi:hypothetical protein QCD79_32985, partial [Pseudomonas quasicaspiana]|nr:hypothetical protein [Pseudomonas quasicaspiana]
ALYQAEQKATGVPTRNDWQVLVPHSDTVMLEGLSLNAKGQALGVEAQAFKHHRVAMRHQHLPVIAGRYASGFL